jgi:virginiamycin B lyase
VIVKIFRFPLKIKSIRKQILYFISVAVLTVSSSLSAFATPTFNNYPISSGYTSPHKVVSSGGSLWYIESPTSSSSTFYIAKMTTSGSVVADYPIGTPSVSYPFYATSLVAAADGNLWFGGQVVAGSSSPYLGSFNTTTGVVTFYPETIPSYSQPTSLVAAADGNIWYTVKSAEAQNYSYLRRFNITTGVETTMDSFDDHANLSSLASGLDGNLWVYNSDTYGKIISSYSTAGVGLTSQSIPSGVYGASLTTTSDGNVWFIGGGNIVKYTPGGTGTFTTYTPSLSPASLNTGPDGAIWFSESGSSAAKIGRITSSGTMTEYTIPGSGVSLGASPGITIGPDGAIWFGYSDSAGQKLGRLPSAPTFDNHPISSGYTSPTQLVSSGGSLWYLEYTSSPSTTSIAKMTPSGSITNYPLGSPSVSAAFGASNIVAGSDGNIWFSGKVSGSGSPYVGFLNVTTGAVTFYLETLPSYSSPSNLVAGSDGNIWYTVKSANAQNYSYLRRLNITTGVETTIVSFDNYANLTSMASSPDGTLWIYNADVNQKCILNYSIATATMLSSTNIPLTITLNGYAMTVTSDGNVWINGNAYIVKYTPSGSGTFTTYTPSLTLGNLGSMVGGPDGALWFRENGSSTAKIGRVTSSGTMTEYAIPGSSVVTASGVTTGPDGALWFNYSNSTGQKIGRLGY